MNILKHKGLEVDPSKLNETVQVKNSSAGVLTLKESDSGETFVMPRIESIHAGKTANHIYYPAEKLKGDPSLGSGVYSWTEPYAKPVIYNHDLNTEVTGRVVRAAYSEYTQAGSPGIFVVPRITEPNAVQAVRDGRLLTVSIGAHTNSAICSICGTDIINEGYCGHMKGEEYDGETAHWITGDVFFQELSWVNQPADSNAFVVDTDVDTKHEMSDTEESLHNNKNIHEYYGIPKAIPLTEAVSKTNEKEGTAEVGKKKANSLDSLKEATKNAKTFLEAIEIDLSSVEVQAGESVVVPNTGEAIPAGASVSVNHEDFKVELNADQDIVLTAAEELEEDSYELEIAVTVDGQKTTHTVPVAIQAEDLDDDEDDDKDDDKDPEDNKEPEDDKDPEETPGEPEPEPEEPEVDPEEPEKDPEEPEKDPEEPEQDPEEPEQEPDSGEENPESGEQDPEPEPENPGDGAGEENPDETPDEPDTPADGDEEDPTDDGEVEEALTEAVSVIETLKSSNTILKGQIKALTEELKSTYIERIVQEYDGNLSEEYITKLEGRQIESLKETIEDIESGFLKVEPQSKNKDTAKRTVQKVTNPIQENHKDSEKENKEVTENMKISMFSRLFSE